MLAYQKGRLISWNDNRGFGFIEPENNAQKVFIHISALRKGGRRPQKGDMIHYQLDMDQKDRVQAINASILGVNYQTTSFSSQRQSGRYGQRYNNKQRTTVARIKRASSKFVRGLITFGIIALLSIIFGEKKPRFVNNSVNVPSSTSFEHQKSHSVNVPSSTSFEHQKSHSVNNPADFSSTPSYSQKFSCTGKIYCSEMNSCAEAKFYLQNCPGVKIDGDGDGIPCEDQWCGH